MKGGERFHRSRSCKKKNVAVLRANDQHSSTALTLCMINVGDYNNTHE